MNDRSISSQQEAPFDREAFQALPCVRVQTDPAYQPPTPEQVKLLRNHLTLGQVACAKLLGVSYNPEKGSTTIRRWEAAIESSNHRSIPYSAWRLMLAAAQLVDLDDDLVSCKKWD